jgi:exopolysaccharide biosynthesis polyprenyl glycosylphosphotransferase
MDPNQTLPRRTFRFRSTEKRSTLLLGDVFIAVFSLLSALYMWAQGPEWYKFSWAFLQERVPLWFYLMPVLWLILLSETYSTRRSTMRRETIQALTMATAVFAGIYLAVFFVSDPSSLPRRAVAIFIGVVFILTLIWRLIYIQLFTAPLFLRRMVIVGAGRAGSSLAKVIHELWPPPFYVVGMVDDDPKKVGQEIEGFPVLGTSNDLFDLVNEHQVTDLVFAITGEMNQQTFKRLLEAEERGIEVTSMANLYEELLGRVPISLLQSDWVLRSFIDQSHMGGFFEIGKRLIDIIGSLVGLIILAVASIFIAPLIVLDSGFPVFYRQVRLGRNGKPYNMIKFRTMKNDAEKDGIARPAEENDNRATRIGHILRKTHLDELPQFYNIFRGEMSLVGPRSERPEIVEELQSAIPFYRARLFVKPGLTGWAQVNYGYASGVEANALKLEYDLYYIKHRTIGLDLLIMFRTVWTVIGFRGR